MLRRALAAAEQATEFFPALSAIPFVRHGFIGRIAGMDVVTYTGGNFAHDLDGMKHPLTDATCTKCHRAGTVGGFHASPKHTEYTAACLGCHAAHAKADQAFGFIDYHRWPSSMRERCVSCHPALLG